MFYAIANTVIRQVSAVVAPIVSFIWNENTNNWEDETRNWEG